MSMNITRDSQIAYRYAKALFLAAAHTDRAALHEEYQRVLSVLGDPLIHQVFFHPRTSRERKAQLIGLMKLSDIMENFLLLVVEKGREALLPAIGHYFERQVLQDQGMAVAEVTSAISLSEGQLEELRQKLSGLTGKEVLLRTHVDPRIGGGLVIEVDGKVVDASLKSRLKRFERSLIS
ncbi:ATP synthase F1 subunit delta [Candidatus Darwinibacter acetoxidans]|jgi:F-type H+-transporting ATPase subunit delta